MKYLELCEDIGLGVNLSKSLSSRRGTALEFAKRTFHLGKDVTPVTLKNHFLARTSIPAMIDFVLSYNLTLKQFLVWSGFGFRALALKDLDFSVLRKMGHHRLADQIFLFVFTKAIIAGASIEETLLLKSANSSYLANPKLVLKDLDLWNSDDLDLGGPYISKPWQKLLSKCYA